MVENFAVYWSSLLALWGVARLYPDKPSAQHSLPPGRPASVHETLDWPHEGPERNTSNQPDHAPLTQQR
jgi:hypothetical protein